MPFKAVRGMKDILPREADSWSLLENSAREIFQVYNYREIRTPLVEESELFARGVGKTSDIVSKQMYVFRDRKGRDLALRPEGTAPVIRAYLEHGLARRGALEKLFYLGPFFDDSGLHAADIDPLDPDLVYVLDGEKEWFVLRRLPVLEAVQALQKRRALMPACILRPARDIISLYRGNRYIEISLHVQRTEPFRDLRLDCIEALLREIDQVHLVQNDDNLMKPEEG